MAHNGRQLAAFLDRVRREYPYGIPRDYIRVSPTNSAIQEQLSNEPSRCLFLVCSEQLQLEKVDSELVDAISTKGLGLSLGQWSVTTYAPGIATPELSELIDSVRAPLTIVLGSAPSAGVVESRSHGKVLFSHSLGEIRDSATVKRAFWSLLKAHAGNLKSTPR